MCNVVFMHYYCICAACIGVYVLNYLYECVYIYNVCVCVMCRIGLRVAAFQTHLVDSNPATGDPDPIRT